jgi:hypothetical protein
VETAKEQHRSCINGRIYLTGESHLSKRQVLTALIIIILIVTAVIVVSCRQHDEYTGELLGALPHGNGRLVHSSGALYEGEFHEGKRCGQGLWMHPGGITYEGSWLNDLYHGFGVLHIPGVYHYKGEWFAGQKSGYGTQTWVNGRHYTGQWYASLMHGSGTLYYPDGSYYEGDWQEGRQHGIGTLYQTDGEIISGTWEKGTFIHIPVENIALTTNILVLRLNDEPFYLMAIIVPLDATKPQIEWHSSDPAIASVEAGIITPKGIGETMITAHAEKDKVEANCLVTVLPPPVAVTGVELSPVMLTLNTNDNPAPLALKVIPANADNKAVSFSTGNPDIATVSDTGFVIAQGPGQTAITVRTADGDYEATVFVNVRQPIGQDTN